MFTVCLPFFRLKAVGGWWFCGCTLIADGRGPKTRPKLTEIGPIFDFTRAWLGPQAVQRAPGPINLTYRRRRGFRDPGSSVRTVQEIRQIPVSSDSNRAKDSQILGVEYWTAV